jgi:hypothetical protein
VVIRNCACNPPYTSSLVWEGNADQVCNPDAEGVGTWVTTDRHCCPAPDPPYSPSVTPPYLGCFCDP